MASSLELFLVLSKSNHREPREIIHKNNLILYQRVYSPPPDGSAFLSTFFEDTERFSVASVVSVLAEWFCDIYNLYRKMRRVQMVIFIPSSARRISPENSF